MNDKPLKILRVQTERLAQGGDAVGHLPDGPVVFVPGALPEELVEIEIIKEKKRWARAKLLQVVEPSPDRIPSDCAISDKCGGCDFRHYAYPAEFDAKIAAARETLARIGHVDLDDVAEARTPGTPSDRYRIRARFHLEGGTLGFYRAGSRRIVEVETCPAVDPRIEATLPALAELATHVGDGALLVETADSGAVVTVVDGHAPRHALDYAVKSGAIRGVRMGDDEYGDPTIPARDAVGVDVDTRVPSDRFRQAHGPMTPVLRQAVVDEVGRGDFLYELFCGSGSFTFALAGAFGQIHGWDCDESGIAIGDELAETLGYGHIRFEVADLFGEVPEVPSGATVLLDPPREGADAACRVIATSDAARVCYVSCDVATLARDAATLAEGGWILRSIRWIDMFPRTSHLEAVATFERG